MKVYNSYLYATGPCDDVTDHETGRGGHFDFIFKFKPVVETQKMSVQISLNFVLVGFKTCCDLSQL